MDESVLIAGPSFEVALAPLDALHPVHYSERFLIFRCVSAEQRITQIQALKDGLKSLLERCPLLGGIVDRLQPNHSDFREDWRTIVSGAGLELVVKDVGSQMASFAELQASRFSILELPFELLMPIPPDIGNEAPFAACKVQYSAIEGGTIIAWAMSHSLADGSGTNELTRLLADAVRAVQGASVTSLSKEVVGMDRNVLRAITSERPFAIEDHPAFRRPSPPAADTPTHPFQATSPQTAVQIRLPASKLAQLKKDAAALSTHDALAALIWRTQLLIRSRRSSTASAFPPSTPVRLFFPSDCRRQLGLPAPYIGNAVYQLGPTIELGVLLSSTGLQQAAAAIRRSINAATPELVASYMVELKERWVDWEFLYTAGSTGVAMGTDWTSGELYELDWGEAYGPLVGYRFPGARGQGWDCVLPKLPDGGAEVAVAVGDNEVELLMGAEGFGKYVG